MADFVSWPTATLDGLHLDRVFLVGMSFGGWLALNYAVAAPQRVRKLVLLSPGGVLPMVREFTVRGMLMVWRPTRFRPTLLLIGDREVISNPARALERARRLIPEFEGELVPECRHDMVSRQRDIVDAHVLDFLKKTRSDDRAATAERSVA